ncbi:AMP-binding enzyme [Xenorhabdus bharatensis]|uniref:AMP-binding enzyme n=1 Tax=Xenorhabdus bharatensis TaxID=3136256 RepID=UPI0030F3743A
MFSGRIDNQVKICGHRIELEEIEARILNSKEILLAKVCAVKNEGEDDFLAAFVIPRSQDTFNRKQLAQELAEYLPTYMLPRLFIIDNLPMTANGKIDLHKLMALTSK